jgi:hypothetical protein
MPGGLLFDTDVLVDYLRGLPAAVGFVNGCESPMLVSAITVAELYVGVREGRERVALDGFLSLFHLVPVGREVAISGGLLRRDFGPKHGVGLSDALIAATAFQEKATLVTLNGKHFPMLSDVLAPYRKP